MYRSAAYINDLLIAPGEKVRQVHGVVKAAARPSDRSDFSFAQVMDHLLLARQDRPRASTGPRQEIPPGRSLADLMEVRLSQRVIQASNLGSPKTGRIPIGGHSSLAAMERRLKGLMQASNSSRYGKGPIGNTDFDHIIDEAANRHGVPPKLIRAVIKAESNFNPRATSSAGAMGLMQLMPATARELGVRQPYDPEENIMAGTRYLRELLDRYHGNIPLALAAYNWGMGNLEKGGALPRETRNYIQRVARFYQGYQT